MKNSLSSDTLSRLIQGLSKAIPTKPSIAILDHFLFEVSGTNLCVTAFDGENMVKATMEMLETDTTDNEPNRFCVHARLISDFLRNIPTQPITFMVEEKTITVNYNNGRISFPCVSGKEYPAFNILSGECHKAALSSTMLLDDITRSSSFVAQDTLRPVLNALCFNFMKDGLDVVSCNGQVLMKNRHDDIATEEEAYFLLPTKPALLLRGLLSKDIFDIDIRFDGSAAQFSGGNWQLTCRLIEGRYPKYNAVIPANNFKTLLIDKRQLQEAIRRMIPMSGQAMKTVKMVLDTKTVTLSCEDIDFNTSATETVECDYNADSLTIGLNGDVLNTILTHIPSDKLRMTFSDFSRPVLVFPMEQPEGVEVTSLLMPVLVNR